MGAVPRDGDDARLGEVVNNLGIEWIARVRATTAAGLRSAVEGLPPAVARVAGYHFGWLDAEGRATEGSTGKYLRPMLVFAGAEAVGGSFEAVQDAAVAVELVHGFTLLHDDIIDGDRLRHHRPTAWSVFGLPAALLAGDALLALAFRVLAGSSTRLLRRGVPTLTDAVAEMTEGEVQDVAFEERSDVTLDEYRAMVRGKSGALTGAACALGALAGGADDVTVRALEAFGRELGVAGQIVDDILGVYGDPGTTGKPAGSDVASAKKSYPVLAALASRTEAGEQLRALYGATRRLDEHQVAQAVRLITAAGGGHLARRAAARHTREAVSRISRTAAEPAALHRLVHMARLNRHRIS